MEARLSYEPGMVQLTSCGGEEYEHNDQCRATDVIGQDWSSEVVALFLEDWSSGEWH